MQYMAEWRKIVATNTIDAALLQKMFLAGARNLEAKINEIMESGTGASPYTAAIMVALGAFDDLNKANKRLDNIRDQSKEYVDEAGKSRIERDAALKEIEVLKSKIDQLENLMKLKQLKDSIK